MLKVGLNFNRRVWAGSYVVMALVLSMPAFAQPVGEATGSAAAEGGIFAELGNLAQIAGALNATLVQQTNQARQVAGASNSVVVAPVSGGSSVADKSGGDKVVAKTEGETIRKGPGETARTNTPAGSTTSLPPLVSAREMPDMGLAPSDTTKSVSRSPGMSASSWNGGSVTSMPDVLAIGAGSRGPAVLAKSDPTLRALSKTFNSPAEQRENLAIAKANQEALADLFNAAKKRKDQKSDKATKAEEMAQKMFEENISELMARKAPYKEEDYKDFRDFIAEQKDRLGETDTTATDFRSKAKEAFEMFHQTDESPQTMARKEAYRRFISTEMSEETQELLVPTPHADSLGVFGTTSH